VCERIKVRVCAATTWRSSEVTVLTLHPAHLTLNEMTCMERDSLIKQLLVFNDHCAFRFARSRLISLTNKELRGLLYAARRHYHGKGY
jgi:hypothetical protein